MRRYLWIFLLTIVAYADVTLQDIEFMKKELNFSDSQILEEIAKKGGINFPLNHENKRLLWNMGCGVKFVQSLENLTRYPRFLPLPQQISQKYSQNKKNKNIYILAIGISQYQNQLQFPDLQYTHKDAQDFVRYFLDLGIPCENICLLTNEEKIGNGKEHAKVKKTVIMKMMKELVKAPGTIYFFYSGHGVYSSKEGFFLTCYDTDMKRLKDTACSLQEVKRLLQTGREKEAVVFLDACRSGGGKDVEIEFGEAEEKIRRGTLGSETTLDLKESDKPVLILTACDINELSLENHQAKNGFFTEALLAALQGKGNQNQDDELTMQEVWDYIRFHVPQNTKYRQNPKFSCSRTWSWENHHQKLPVTPEKSESLVKDTPKKPAEDKKIVEGIPERETGSIEIETPSISIPPGWTKTLWEKMWDEKQNHIDFTIPEWERLRKEEQWQCAQTYQEWYARRQGFSVEKVFDVAGLQLPMVLIPPGKFWMGSPENELTRSKDETRHMVTISKAFWLQKTEVTQEQWYKITGEQPWLSKEFMESNSTYPASYVSWKEIQEKFIKKLGKGWSLPTESQWEYACRAGSLTLFYWGDTVEEMGRYANVCDLTAKKSGRFSPEWLFIEQIEDRFVALAPAGSLKPNPFGLYDMIGNVYEWCGDYYGDYPVQAVVDPAGPAGGYSYIKRGGSWYSFDIFWLRCASRGRGEMNIQDGSLGLRLMNIYLKP
jgi:formylglycine-generating enzyme required for sulfatase activity